MAEMILGLNTPGMTSLHKAGLAGLYMTLNTFSEQAKTIDGLSWQLEPKKITLNWQQENPGKAFSNLLNKSFWLDNDGFIRLAGLEAAGSPSQEQKHLLYGGLLNSFLQFGPHRPTGQKRTLSYDIDGKLYWLKEFAPIIKFRHQDAVDDFIGKNGKFNRTIEAAGWLYPGGGQRHVAHGATKLEEPLELALPLLFAPTGVLYFNVSSRSKGRKARLAMLIPDIKNLESYAEIRQVFATKGVLDMTASSASDAVLRMLTAIEGQKAANSLASLSGDSFLCRLITFGIVPWNEKQKSRTAMLSVVSGNLRGLSNYFLAAAIFKNRWQRIQEKRDANDVVTEPERHFVSTFSAREMISDNIAQGRSWYADIANYMSQKDIHEQLLYEQKEIHEMVEKADFDEERERIFIRVCYEAWRRHLGRLGGRAQKENADFGSLVRKDSTKLRATLLRSKNAESLRETVVSFWSRAGTIPELQGDGLMTLLPLFNDKNWRKSRDLALLALVSYQPKTPEETAALAVVANEEEEI